MSNCIIKIYQEKNPTFRVDDSQTEYNLNNYDKVYDYDFKEVKKDRDLEICEYYYFITNKGLQGMLVAPYVGRSMSVGDIIVINDHAYICASFGWNKVTLK